MNIFGNILLTSTKSYLTHGTKYLVTWKNYLPCVMDERYSWMKKMDDKSNGLTFIKDGCQTHEKSWMTQLFNRKRWNNFMLVLS